MATIKIPTKAWFRWEFSSPPLEWLSLNTMRCRDTPVISLLTFTLRLLNQISKWTGFRCNMRFTSKLVIHSYAQRTWNASYCELFGERAFWACLDRFYYYTRYVTYKEFKHVRNGRKRQRDAADCISITFLIIMYIIS